MKVIHQPERNRTVTLNGEGNIQSIKPIIAEDKYSKFNALCEEVLSLSAKYPTERWIVDLMAVPEKEYQMIREDYGLGDSHLDHIDKFYYNVAQNGTVIAHKAF